MTTPQLTDLRRALANMEGEVLALGGKRGARVHRLVESLAFNAPVDDSAVALALSGNAQTPRRAGPHFTSGRAGKQIAVIQMHGVALPKFEYPGLAFSTLAVAAAVTALSKDSTVGAIVLDIDSPGGQVTGTPEAAHAVFEARERVPVVAMVNTLAASAAFWIASGASEILATESSEVGSIGVYLLHLDHSRMLDAAGVTPTFISNDQSPFKTEANPFEPLSDTAKAHEKKNVNRLGRQFIQDVARGRGITSIEVTANYGRGRTVSAGEARRAGMIDRVGGFSDALIRARKGTVGDGAHVLDSPAVSRQRRLKLEALRG